MSMQELQEFAYGVDADYAIGSPHLRHWRLRQKLTLLFQDALASLSRQGLPLTVLEIGAGHGGYTEVALAMGCRVTATEMSRHSVHRLRQRFLLNSNFEAVLDADGSLDVLDSREYSMILCSSVLHHIPDYFGYLNGALKRHLSSNGCFCSIQDPLWYATLDRSSFYLGKVAYGSWRLAQGRYSAGLRTISRRARGIYDEEEPGDMVEYHTVRQGVDHHGLSVELSKRFDMVSVVRYWSTQSPLWQRVGEMSGRANTFAILATGHRASA